MRRRITSMFLVVLLLVTFFVATVSMNVSADVIEDWVARYSSPKVGVHCAAYAIAVDDSSGNVYVTGTHDAIWVLPNPTGEPSIIIPPDNPIYLTIGYNSEGTLDWQMSSSYDSWVGDVAVDSSGNVYVTGVGEGTFAYDSTGTQLWNKDRTGVEIAIDSTSGTIYIAGFESSENYDDYTIIAYDSSGTKLWEKTYNGPGNYHDHATGIAVDETSGNVYVTGYSPGIGTGNDYATVAYDSDGEQLWVARFNSKDDVFDNAQDIAVDSSGNIYVTGTSYFDDADYVTLAYDSSGTPLWMNFYDGPIGGRDCANELVVDPTGNVYVTGYSEGSDKDFDYATVAYSAFGAQLWAQRYDGPDNWYDLPYAIALDSIGNVYVGGGSVGLNKNYDYTIVAYDSLGDQIWVERYNGPADDNDFIWDMVIDSDDNIYVTGQSWGTDVNDYATIKYVSPQSATGGIIKDIDDMDLPPGTEQALTTVLENARDLIEQGKEDTALRLLQAFINQVEAMRGKKLTDEEANALIAAAQEIIDGLS